MDQDASLNETQMKILNYLRQNAMQKPEEIARQLGNGANAAEIGEAIHDLEQKGYILKYKAVIDWNKFAESHIKALIEVKVTPQRGYGFDRIAQRIYNFPEVKTCYLLSGAYDLLVELEGANLQEISRFVAEKLSTQESVQSTVTHFILKKYKEDGDILSAVASEDERLAVSP